MCVCLNADPPTRRHITAVSTPTDAEFNEWSGAVTNEQPVGARPHTAARPGDWNNLPEVRKTPSHDRQLPATIQAAIHDRAPRWRLREPRRRQNEQPGKRSPSEPLRSARRLQDGARYLSKQPAGATLGRHQPAGPRRAPHHRACRQKMNLPRSSFKR
jgi:hypothetical protein